TQCSHSVPADGQKLLEGIETMNLEDQKNYRTDSDFRDKVDSTVDFSMHDAQKEAAMHMLDNLAAGNYPEGDFIDKINIEAGKSKPNEPQVIRYVEDEFRKDHQRVEQLKKEGKPIDPPELYERITNPKTSKDEALKERLLKALDRALENDEYEKWVMPLLENGRLTVEQRLELANDVGDKKETFKDIQNLATSEDPADAQERHRLVTDEYYADQVLGHLPEDQRALVMNMLKHGEERHRMLTDSAY